jgi:putative tryptophan/tyrosine transport system substrate-binding protein
MRRLALVVALAAAWLAGCTSSARLATGTAPHRLPVVGYLGYTNADVGAPYLGAFRERLAALGFVEGRNVTIVERYADGHYERLGELAGDLVRGGVDVLLTPGAGPTVAATAATATLPIVMLEVGDPVAYGLVRSLERPGGNVTGVSSIFSDLAPLHLDLLRRTVPGAMRVAVLWNPANLAEYRLWGERQTTARVLGWQLQTVPVSAVAQLDSALATIADGKVDALYSLGDPLILSQRRRVVDFALEHRLPTLFGLREFVEAGGLMAYGPSALGLYRHAAAYVARILTGARPGDLPIESPAKYELVVNLRTARTLGLTIPPAVVEAADAVIR